jgi:MFS transporter, SHS family, lactate transporter
MHFIDRGRASSRSVGETTPGWQLAVTSGILGWTLDAFDFFVVIFLFDALAAHFHVSKADVVYTLTLTLAMRPVGALIFGSLADRFGRKWLLIVCVLYFSAMTVLSGLSVNFTMFAIMRALYGMGMGGYWGIGASYAMESAPARLRGFLSGLLQAGYPFGYLVAAVAMQTVTTHLGWRSAFFIGSPVAVLISILTWFSPESDAWQSQRVTSMKTIFGSLLRHARIFFYLLALMSVMLCLSHGTQDLYPDFLKSLPGIAERKIAGMNLLYGIPVLYSSAGIIGALIFGYLSEKIGRRYSIMLALAASLLSIPAWAFGVTVLALTLGSCAMQAGVQGAWGVIPAHINELSPPSVRGLFPGFVYQLGFVAASPATIVELKLRNVFGYCWALTAFEAAVILTLLMLVFFGPEARGRDFSDPGASPAFGGVRPSLANPAADPIY